MVPALPRRLRPLLGAPVPLLCGVLSIDDEGNRNCIVFVATKLTFFCFFLTFKTVREHLGTDALIVEIQNSLSAQPFATMHWSSGVLAEIM